MKQSETAHEGPAASDQPEAPLHSQGAFQPRVWRTLIGWVVFAVVVLILEATLFNLPFWRTANLVPQQLVHQQELAQGNPESVHFEPMQTVRTLYIATDKSARFTISILDEGDTIEPLPVSHSVYVDVPPTRYVEIHSHGEVSGISLILEELLDPYQAAEVTEDDPAMITVSILIDQPIPFNFSLLRVVLIIGIAVFLWTFLPQRRIYRMAIFAAPKDSETTTGTRVLLKPVAKRTLIAVTAALCALSLLQLLIVPAKLGHINEGSSTVTAMDYANQQRAQEMGYELSGSGATAGDTESRVQKGEADKTEGSKMYPHRDTSPLAYYYPGDYEGELSKLARAFAAGQLYLLDQPYPELLEFENPYDPFLRNQELDIVHSFYWDTAFYDGHYYVYFGALPVLVFYLPYFLMTGQDLPNFIPIAVCLMVMLVGLAMLLVRMARRWFPQITLGSFLLCFLLVFFGAQLGWLTLVPSIYEVPVAMALMLLVWAAFCFITLDEHPWRAPGGALLVALIFACRPQIGLFGLLFIPFGIRALGKMEGLRLRAGYLGAALAPIVIVFVLIGWYNAARFGSPFDFGATYNLTTNDMRNRPLTLDMALMALFYDLIQLPVFQPVLPFFEPALPMSTTEARDALQVVWRYGGNITVEAPIGGLLWLSPLVWFNLAFFWEGRGISTAGRASSVAAGLRSWLVSWKGFVLVALLIALIVMVVDGEGAGILPRYVLDFSLPLLVLGAAGFMRAQHPDARWVQRLGIAMLFIGLLVCASIAFHPNTIRPNFDYDMQQTLAALNYLLFS